MANCSLCQDQSKLSRNGKPHVFLHKIAEPRIFKGAKPRGFVEQDYQCEVCKARFTHSTSKNDQAWTVWVG